MSGNGNRGSGDLERKAEQLIALAAGDVKIAGYLAVVLRKTLVSLADANLMRKIDVIREWLCAERAAGARWLSDLDPQGRPRRLMQYNFERTINRAARETGLCIELPKPFLPPDNEHAEIVRAFADGFFMLRLKTMSALVDEGLAMGHCMANAGKKDEFSSKLAHGMRYFSLRDQFNRAHATIEVDPEKNMLYQCFGKQSSPPIPKYLPYVTEFIDSEGLDILNSPRSNGFVLQDGQRHSIYLLPEGYRHRGNLDLQTLKIDIPLPRGLTVMGDLDMTGCENQTRLPDGLTVHGSGKFSGCMSLKVIENARFDKDLSVTGSGVRQLGRAVYVGGTLWAGRTAQLETVWPFIVPPLQADFSESGLEYLHAFEVRDWLNLSKNPNLRDIGPQVRAGAIDLDWGRTEDVGAAAQKIRNVWNARLLREMQGVNQMVRMP